LYHTRKCGANIISGMVLAKTRDLCQNKSLAAFPSAPDSKDRPFPPLCPDPHTRSVAEKAGSIDHRKSFPFKSFLPGFCGFYCGTGMLKL
jgi:hypothetical protein